MTYHQRPTQRTGPEDCPTSFYKDPQGVYRAAPLDRFAWLVHGFGARQGSIPAGIARVAWLKQIHSAEWVYAAGRAGLLGPGDALIENTPGAVVGVRTADCLPILLADERLRAVAAIHAGWRGTAAGIARRTVEAMSRRFGSRPADLHAAIGPGIGKCCYEVGPEVAERFGEPGQARLDLADANRRQLLQAGLDTARIYAANLCTMCLAGEFHSFRRDREAAGRMRSCIGIRAALE